MRKTKSKSRHSALGKIPQLNNQMYEISDIFESRKLHDILTLIINIYFEVFMYIYIKSQTQ